VSSKTVVERGESAQSQKEKEAGKLQGKEGKTNTISSYEREGSLVEKGAQNVKEEGR